MAFAIDINALLDVLIRAPDQAGAAEAAAAALAVTVKAERAQARPLGGLTLADLVPYSELHQRAGLYVVLDASGPVYVGVCWSQPFLVQLPALVSVFEGDHRGLIGLGARPGVVHPGATAGFGVRLFTTHPRWEDGEIEREGCLRALLLLKRSLEGALGLIQGGGARRLSADAQARSLLEIDVMMRALEAQEIALEDESAALDATGAALAAGAAGRWQDAALQALGIAGETALVVKVTHTWKPTDSADARRDAVLGDWPCSLARAPNVKVVVGVAHAEVVEAWPVGGYAVLDRGRVRFCTRATQPLSTSSLTLPNALLKAQNIRYIL
jgi:hypothetical protein